jgi:hypothetical protein
MRVLIVRDDGELRRIERAIAEFEGRPPAERLRKSCLLQALHHERAELLRCNPCLRGARTAAHREYRIQ